MKSLASPKFHRTSFQNKRFLRGFLEISHSSKFLRPSFQNGFLQISQNKLRKRTFCARLPRNFIKQASKTGVSCEASSKFLRPSFQNERFVRGFLEISKNKLPKRTFRARLPRNFTEQASKTSVSCEASSKFHRTKLPKPTFRARLPPNFIEQSFQNERFARRFREFP